MFLPPHLKLPQRYDWLIIFLLGLVALACAWIYRNFAQDDAFITYRYAQNIANGYGFVYNLHESVLGTTTPLYTLLLALLKKLSGQDIRLISHLLSILSLWADAVILYLLGKDKGPLLAVGVSLVFITNPLLISAVGMETFFFIFLLLLAITCYVKSYFKLTGFWLALLMLTRYEAIFLVAILGGHFLVQRRQLPLWLVTTGLLFLSWLTFAWYTFGNIVPHSASTKLFSEASYSFFLGAIVWWGIYTLQSGGYYLYPPLILLGSYTIIRNKKLNLGYTLILAWTGVYFIGASFVAGSFPWYYGPLIPGFSILLIWGIDTLARFLSTTLKTISLKKYTPELLQLTLLILITLSFIFV